MSSTLRSSAYRSEASIRARAPAARCSWCMNNK
ncbi:MAG: hypothetical protein HC859_12460 [Bacteroidia bacterium]|nr:hypothetical protein [Bacteroidia bacterium]